MFSSRAVASTVGYRSRSASIARWSKAHSSSRLLPWTSATCLQRSISSTAPRASRNDPNTADPEFAFLGSTTDPETSATPSSNPTPPVAEPSLNDAPAETISNPRPQPSESSLPWYLQNRPAPTPQQAAIIPDLPPNPPPLLPTLLDYLANTAGLDDITLLDLRHLDPPPALGPKLIMLVCTARSEKHLHVAADRFCRYLRREHKLRAQAQGLLGRNELKIKLRRKAKRMKMLANVGGGGDVDAMANLDDGIRTKWICCTVGKVEAHPDDTHMPGDDVQEFVGFREVKPGVNIVVQMFTEDKRVETDLETLWGGIVRTNERKESAAEQVLKDLEEEEEEEVAEEENVVPERVTQRPTTPASPSSPTPTWAFKRTRPTTGDVFPPAHPQPPFQSQQVRRVHTVGLRL